jgi:hypothetical protein
MVFTAQYTFAENISGIWRGHGTGSDGYILLKFNSDQTGEWRTTHDDPHRFFISPIKYDDTHIEFINKDETAIELMASSKYSYSINNNLLKLVPEYGAEHLKYHTKEYIEEFLEGFLEIIEKEGTFEFIKILGSEELEARDSDLYLTKWLSQGLSSHYEIFFSVDVGYITILEDHFFPFERGEDYINSYPIKIFHEEINNNGIKNDGYFLYYENADEKRGVFKLEQDYLLVNIYYSNMDYSQYLLFNKYYDGFE